MCARMIAGDDRIAVKAPTSTSSLSVSLRLRCGM
jgi:hypothetical protein